MTNKFEKAYQEYKTFDKAFDEAEERMDEIGKEEARYAYKEWEKAKKDGKYLA